VYVVEKGFRPSSDFSRLRPGRLFNIAQRPRIFWRGVALSIQPYMLGWMSYEITGHKAGLEGAFIRTQAHTASDALRFAREWAEQGVTGITIVSPKGESFDIDRFGMIVSTNEGHSDADRPSQRP
jgi:hypothetical protein